MEYFVKDAIGQIHLIAATFALLFGTLILVKTKGTKTHKQVGYAYVISMIIVIITAFITYKLFNGWGIFHYAAVISTLSLGLGMIPIWIKKPVKRWKYLHFSFMYWSVIGLYAAFASEMLTRIPETPFFGMVGIATGIIMMVGGVFFGINKAKWMKVFE